MNDTESNDSCSATADGTDLNGGVATESKRGRNPAQESRSAELRQRIAQWKSAPPDERQPPTLTALAEELGISRQLASYYATPLPTPEERWRRQMERMYREALAVVHDYGTDRQGRQVACQVLGAIKGRPLRRSTGA